MQSEPDSVYVTKRCFSALHRLRLSCHCAVVGAQVVREQIEKKKCESHE